MAAKLQHAIDPLLSSNSINSNLCKPGYQQLDGTWDCFERKRLKQDKHQQHKTTVLIRFEDCSTSLSSSMDRNRMNEKKNQDYIKKTMQMQDSIFQHQVRELHRVYNVQRRLMCELRNEVTNLPKSMYPKANFHNATIERSGSCSGGKTAKMSKKSFDLENLVPPPEARSIEEAQAGPSSSSFYKAMNINECVGDDDDDLELTLSLGGAKNSCVVERKSLELGLESGSSNSSNSSRIENHQHQQPRWLFQGLNLNKT